MKDSLYKYRAFMRSAYDGDSARCDLDLGFNNRVNNRELRLVGIDTPEIRGRSPIEKRMAKAARAVLLECVPEGSEFVLESRADKSGKYGRALARVWIEKDSKWLCVNDRLLEIKLAQPYEGKGKRIPWVDWYAEFKADIDPLLERYA